MAFLKFLHCADLHIDSPFKGIGEIHPAFRDTLYDSTYRSFSKIVDFAITEKVDFVVICGDIYDSAEKSLKAQLFFRDELLRLSEAGIPAYIVHGNHDPLDAWSASLQWPSNVKIFGGKSVEQVYFQRGSDAIACIYGISYRVRNISDNLALQFQHQDTNIPAIALLHSNVGNNKSHEPYAPASIGDLLNRGIDYWALGHVHQKAILRDGSPAIVYPGNCQARNPRETGGKGCYLVEMETDRSCSLNFIETDLVRYGARELNIESLSVIDDLIAHILATCDNVARDFSDRTVVLRLTLTGRTALHNELRMGENMSELLETVQENLLESGSTILMNQILLESSLPYDVDELRMGNDFVADLISLYDELEDFDADQWNEIRSALQTLYQTWRGYRLLEEPSNEQLREFAIQALHQTLDYVVKTE